MLERKQGLVSGLIYSQLGHFHQICRSAFHPETDRAGNDPIADASHCAENCEIRAVGVASPRLPGGLILVSGNLRKFLAASLLAISTFTSEVPAIDTIERKASPTALEHLEETVSRWVSSGDPVGAELLVIQDGQVLLSSAQGWHDREQRRLLEAGAIFRIRSMTKPILGTAVLLLRDSGKLDLDDPVSQYLPELDTPRLRAITIRQLLSHTSGLGNSDTGGIGLPMAQDEYPDLESLVEAIVRIPRQSLGVGFTYHDSNSAVLGLLVARLSGKPLEQFLEDSIFVPLGMTDSYTTFRPDVAWADKMTSTYGKRPGTCAFERYWSPAEEQGFAYFRASGGVYSTTRDYARFLTMWLDGGMVDGKRFLSETAVREALTLHASRPTYDKGGGYGLHWTIFGDREFERLPAIFGHSGSDGTMALAFPEHRRIVLYFTQSRGSDTLPRFYSALGQVKGFEEVNAIWSAALREEWEDAVEHNRTPGLELSAAIEGRYDSGANLNFEIKREGGTVVMSGSDGFRGEVMLGRNGELLVAGDCRGIVQRWVVERDEDNRVVALNGMAENGNSLRITSEATGAD